MAVDTERNVLVLFGGDSGETDTWEFNLAEGNEGWTRQFTAVSPPPRGGHAMIYDPVARKVVLTGGEWPSSNGSIRSLKDVWEFTPANGGTPAAWTQIADLPEARSRHAMTYDTNRSKTVLYGGISDASSPAASRVLERDSAADSVWQARDASFNPGALINHAMAFDSQRSVTVLLESNTKAPIDVWEWNGSVGTWSLRSFATSTPNACLSPAVVYDSSRQRLVMTAGSTDGGDVLNQVWEYVNGTTWTRRADIPSAGRYEHALAYAPARGWVLLLGGLQGNTNPTRDLLAFSGASNAWSTIWNRPAVPSNPIAPISPAPRLETSTAYDEVGERTIIFGGSLVTRENIVTQVDSRAFAFDGVAWSALNWTSSRSTYAAPMMYDPLTRRMLVYGGSTDTQTSTARSEIEEVDLGVPNAAWTTRQVQGAATPGRRVAHAAALDRERRVIVVHGGFNQNNVRLSDTWLFDLSTNTWTKSEGATSPSARARSAMVYDEHRRVIVLFGGATSSGLSDETWEWNGLSWQNPTQLVRPLARRGHSLIYNRKRGTVMLFGGDNGANSSSAQRSDVWEYDGSWKQLDQSGSSSDPAPIGRVFSSVCYDSKRDQIIMFSGTPFGNQSRFTNGQTWLATTPPVPPTIVQQPMSLSVCTFATDSFLVVADPASGCTSQEYQWQAMDEDGEWTDVSGGNLIPIIVGGVTVATVFGATSSTLTFELTPAFSMQPGYRRWRCLVRGCCGSITSSEAAINVVFRGDADYSGAVDFLDLTAVLANFGNIYTPTGSSGPGDADGSGSVNFLDITTILANFGCTYVCNPCV